VNYTNNVSNKDIRRLDCIQIDGSHLTTHRTIGSGLA